MELAESSLGAVSAICEKLPLVISPHFLLFDTRKSCVFQIFLLLRSIIKAYLCPNMIDFDCVDFSERGAWILVINFF